MASSTTIQPIPRPEPNEEEVIEYGREENLDVLTEILRLYPRQATLPNNQGMTPLALLAQGGRSLKAVEMVFDVAPESIHVADVNTGLTAFALAGVMKDGRTTKRIEGSQEIAVAVEGNDNAKQELIHRFGLVYYLLATTPHVVKKHIQQGAQTD